MYYDDETFGEFIKKKSARALIIIMIICVSINIYLHSRKGIYLDTTFMTQKSSNYYEGFRKYVKMNREKDCIKYEFNYQGQIRKAILNWKDKKAIIEFDDGTKLEKYWNDGILVDEEDDFAVLEYTTVDVTENVNNYPVDDYELGVFMCNAYEGNLVNYGEEEYSFGMVGSFYGAVVFFFGILRIYFPNKSHIFGSRWRYEDIELSEEGLFFEKVGGVILIIFSFIVVLFL